MAPPNRINRRPASAPPRVTKWALLDHFQELGGGGSALLSPERMHPGFWKTEAAAVSQGLQDRVDALLKTTPALKEVRFALVDLTQGRHEPQFAGNKANEQVFTGSLAKIACVYAAFQLQYDLNALAANDPSLKTAQALFDSAWLSWTKTQTKDPAETVKKLPHDLSVQGSLMLQHGSPVALAYDDWNPKHPNPRRDGSPNLPTIFDVDDSKTPLTVTFKRSANPPMLAVLAPDNNTDFLLEPKKSQKFLDRIKKLTNGHTTFDTMSASVKSLFTQDSKNGVPFFERLILMADQSNNDATRTCILDVGYLYIASSLWQAGLFRPERHGGLWLSAPYVIGPGWIQTPVPQQGDWSQQYQCTSPAAAAAFMTLLAQGRLISDAANDGIKSLLDKRRDTAQYPGNRRWLARSFIGDWLGIDFARRGLLGDDLKNRGFDDASDPYPADEIYSKIGVGGSEQTSDCAFISHKVHGKKLEYVMAFIDLPKSDWNLLSDLIPGLDDCILQNNP